MLQGHQQGKGLLLDGPKVVLVLQLFGEVAYSVIYHIVILMT